MAHFMLLGTVPTTLSDFRHASATPCTTRQYSAPRRHSLEAKCQSQAEQFRRSWPQRLSSAQYKRRISAQAGKDELQLGRLREIPIFPLNVVAFPTQPCPLNIFEARYRVLFNTLLAGAEGLEEDLIQHEKPFCGSRQFGMCYVGREGGMAGVGTLLKIEKHFRAEDGRLLVQNEGVERFKVLKVMEERPVLICQVEMLEEDADSSEEVQQLGKEVTATFKDLIQLNIRMKRIKQSEADVDPKLEEMSPRELSYWIALIFSENPLLQQTLLEHQTVLQRLTQQQEILAGTVSFLRAKVALQSAFEPSPEGSSGEETSTKEPPVTGGPD